MRRHHEWAVVDSTDLCMLFKRKKAAARVAGQFAKSISYCGPWRVMRLAAFWEEKTK